MSEELKALENIRKLFIGSPIDLSQQLDHIETALNEKINIENRLDEIFENHNIKSFTELEQRLESREDYEELVGDLSIEIEINKENQNKLKALEIIKKHISIYEERIVPYDKPKLWHVYLKMEGYLDEKHEEYDLLKEALL